MQNFMSHWFAGLVDGLEQVDEPAQDHILRACGLACGQSYTIQVFQEAWQQCSDIDSFLALLAENFPGANYESIDEQTIFVSYAACACDLVQQGWVKSPILCKCSAYNLEQNFEKSLGRPVQVKLKSSILGGAAACLFEVRLQAGASGDIDGH